MEGYLRDGEVDRFEAFHDGWLRTGDLGYVAEGELFVTGRVKDIVIVLGRNYMAEDFEWAAARAAGVRPGRCGAFVPEGAGDREVLLAVEASPEAGSGLARRVRTAVYDALGVMPTRVLVVPPGTIPKTTSGKLRRTAVKTMEASGDLLDLSV
jgi:fatty-acyl-CoA synthase